MARHTLVVCLVLLGLAAGAHARLAPETGLSNPLRALLQAPSCDRVDAHCNTCENRRVNMATTTVCTSCDANYRLNTDTNKCDCAPGYYRASTGTLGATACAACSTGYYCPGGPTGAQTQCASGLTTLIDTAARAEQCVTNPGYGFKQDGSVEQCPEDTFSPGYTRSPCRPCGNGLKTGTGVVGSISTDACKAPVGFYFDKNQAKPCPKGTYSDTLDKTSTCTSCADGVTTSGAQSTDVSACDRAKRGYKYVSANTAAACDVGTYSDADNLATTCTDCPGTGLTTRTTGSKGIAACVAAPGMGFVSETTGAVACVDGQYKAGYNRRGCVSCGTDFKSGTGKSSFSQCWIPQGWGSAKVNGVWTAAECPAGTFGAAADTYGVKSLPCTPCPTGMDTNAVTGASVPEACVTKPGYGYDQASQTAALCEKGYYAAGHNFAECTYCGNGKTTASTGSTSSADCVIAPGYGYVVGEAPEPCPQGSYGTGGAGVACAVCDPAAFTTTAKDVLATAASDCNVCIAGYGSYTAGACSQCGTDTFSQGDSPSACTSCPAGYVSPVGSTAVTDCVPQWTPVDPSLDTIYVNTTDTALVVSSTQTALADCKSACTGNSDCMYFTYNDVSTVCNLVVAQNSGSDQILFKNAPTKYTAWTFDAAKTVGVQISSGSKADVNACAAACDDVAACVAVVYSGTTCKLVGASSDPDVKECAARAIGSAMLSW